MSLRWIGLSIVVVGAVAASCGGGDTSNSGGGGSGTAGGTSLGTGGHDTGGGGTPQETGGSNLGGFGVGGTGVGGLGTGGQPTGGGTATGGNSGTGGTTSTGGGSASGGGGSNGTGGGGQMVLIQDVEDGTVATGTAVTLQNVFVTSTHASMSSTTLTLQEPNGVTKTGVTYPAFAGVAFNANAADVTTFGIGSIVVGDCVTVSGTTSEFHMNTEIEMVTAFTKVTTGCGTAPVAMDVGTGFPVSFSDIATDAGGGMGGAQTETYENVLLTIHLVSVTPATSTSGFFVMPTGQVSMTPNLLIDNFITGPITTVPTYTSITGVLEQFNTFALYPRTTADLVP